MKKRFFKKMISLLVSGCMLASFAGCGNKTGTPQDEGTGEGSKEPITVTFASFYGGTDPIDKVFEETIADIQEQLKDENIIIKVETIPGTDNYVSKMKVLISAEELPDIIIPTGENLMDLAYESGQLVNFTPYFEADPEWEKSLSEQGKEYNTRDGQIYGIPMERMTMGYFYNKEIFEEAQIKPAETWEEFWSNCEAIKAAGYTPLSMDTAEGAWYTGQLMGAIVGTSGETGNAFMNTYQPTDYNFPEMVDAVADIQKAFLEYTTPDAVGGNWAPGASHFYQGETAMFFNGAWTIKDFYDRNVSPEGFEDKVGVAMYPENGMYDAPALGVMCGSKDKEHADAAMKVIKLYTSAEVQMRFAMAGGTIPDSPLVEINDDVRAQNPILVDLVDLTQDVEWTFGDHSSRWYMNVWDEMSANLLPQLAQNKITPEEFCAAITKKAQENQ
ncbi:MAG: extracellular solute-binding protein [Lachnospiraceae bacterium]|nr:extracellular solute-binding protein [Lachnospiraceae bacterium]